MIIKSNNEKREKAITIILLVITVILWTSIVVSAFDSIAGDSPII